MVREKWFIITLVTHSSGVSRGIHHKCQHPLNPTKLYVSGWVESSLSVLIGKSKHAWMLYGYWMVKIDIWLYDINVVGSSLPCCCVVVLYVVLLSCDDHQFDWWEQMDEVLVANKGMVISLLSHLGWTYFLHVFFRAMAHVSLYAFLLYTLY